MKIIGRKALSLLISITMLICMLPMGLLAVSAEVVDSNIADSGTGTLSDPYLISSAEQMKNVYKHLDACFKLTDDIDVGNITPIGDSSKPFIGIFDGNGHTVTVDIETSSEYAGLFGYVGGTIKNLGVEGSIKDSCASVAGALAGRIYTNGYIENCFSDCDVEIKTTANDQAFIGGLVGQNYGRIINCYSKGNLIGDTDHYGSSIGGFVGYNYGNIINCYSTGNVSTGNVTDHSRFGAIGGFVGGCNDSETVNCYATGNITENKPDSYENKGVGGFAGRVCNTKISNCYSTGEINAANNVGGFIGLIDSGCTKLDISEAYFNEDSEQTSMGVVQEPKGIGYNASGISDITDKVTGKSAGEMTNASFAELLSHSPSDVFHCGWEIDDENQNYPVIISNKGTEEDPFKISEASQMDIVRKYPFGHYKLTADITVNNLPPIGTFENSFFGGFDGGGKTVTLTADSNTINDCNGAYIGLFGVIERAGKVQNLNLTGSIKANQSSTWNYYGGIVGRNYGTVSDCNVDVTIDGSAKGDSVEWINVGALAGNSSGFITDCHAEGKVEINSNSTNTEAVTEAGGLVGENEGGYIVNGDASCKITVNYIGEVDVGGLVGINHGSLDNCIATGDVSGSSESGLYAAGGLAGAFLPNNNDNSITDCNATGSVTGNSEVEARIGGFIGQDNGDISGSYATGSVEGNGARVLAGGFAGFSNSGSITSSYSKGSVTVENSDDARVGGFIGQNQVGCSIEKCYSTGNNAVTKSKMVRVGGFTGYNRLGTIKDCYTVSNVEGSVLGTLTAGAIGGFAGTNLSAIEGCYAAGTVKAAKTEADLSSVITPETFGFRTDVSSGSAVSVGGFAALNTSTGTIAKSFFDTQTTGQTVNVGENSNQTAGSINAVELKTSEMTGTAAESKMTGVSFDSVWKTTENTKQNWYYPQLASAVKLDSKASLDSVTLPITITSFSDLNDKIKYIAFGAADASSIKFPGTVKAIANGIYDIDASVSRWTSGMTFPAVTGNYAFEPDLTGYTVASGTALPQITVKVAEKPSNKSSNTASAAETKKEQTETKVDTLTNAAVVTTKADSVTTNGDTTSIETVVPSVTVDNTNTSTNGSTVDTAKKTAIAINVPTQAIKEQLTAKKDVELTVTVPSDVARDANANVAVNINANKEILQAAKENLSDVTIKIKDAGTQQLAYSWTFKGEDLAKSTVPVTDVNIAMSVHLTTEIPKVNATTPNKTGMVLSFDHSGALPSVASVTISAVEKGFKPGQSLYFYYYNPVTQQIEPLSGEAYTVDVQGNVTVQISHCSDYVLLPDAVRSLTLDTLHYTMPVRASYEIGLKLNGVSGSSVKAYSSTSGIAKVTKLKNGNYMVTAMKPGLTYIMFDVYDNKNKKIIKSHASVRLTVKKGTVPNGSATRQTAVF